MLRPDSVALVTVTYNSADVLDDFLTSLRSQDRSGLHLIAVDNASTDDTLAILDRAGPEPATTVIANDRNEGVARGNNQGIVRALEDGFEWVLLINNDTEFGPTAISDLVRAAVALDARIVSPFIEAMDPPASAWFVGGRLSRWRGARAYHDHIREPIADVAALPHTTEYAPTCVLLVHRSAFANVGLMDESFFVYGDDVDFAFRAAQACVPYWVTPDARFLHKVSSLTGPPTGPFRARWGTRNWVLVARKHCTRPQLLAGLIYIFAWIVSRLIQGEESFDITRRRLRAAVEGLRAPLVAPPEVGALPAAPNETR